MRRKIRTLPALLLAALSMVLVAGQVPALAAGTAQGVVPSAVPGLTPHVLDNPTTGGPAYKVLDMAQATSPAGTRIVVVGQFTQVQNPNGANGGPAGPILTRNNIFAFDPATGQVDTAFAPSVTGGVIDAVAAGPNNTVYIGGSYNTVNGTTVRRLAQLNLADGSLVTAFRPQVNAEVQDVKLLGNRLFLAGSFTTVGGVAHGGLATVNATSGAVDPYLSLDVSGHHNYNGSGAQAAVGAVKIDINPAGNRMIAIGNFKNVAGVLRDQAASISLPSGPGAVAVLDNWAAPGFQAACKKTAFDSWVRDVQWSPDGSYFVIDGTGAYTAPPAPATSPPPTTPAALCDSAARFNAGDTGTSVLPYWIAYSGGDSFFSVAITDQAVYVGGHERWLNNPLAGDNAAAGAVPRPGLAALDPLNGLPLTWNPGRNPRGYGATAILATSTGIYVGSDQNYIGNRQYPRYKLAFFSTQGGKATPSQATGSLPGTLYLAGNTANGGTDGVESRSFTGTSTSGDTGAATGSTTWSNARGAFMVGNQLFYGIKDSSGTFELARRTFNGGTFGTEEILSTPYKDPTWDGVSTGTTNGGLVYDGVFPNFYGPYTNPAGQTVAGDLSAVTGMFYSNGRVYYTKSGSSSLFYRYFSVDRGVVGAQYFTAASSGFGNAGGMFLNGTDLYVVNRTNGNLTKMSFANGTPSGTATVVDSTHNWKGNALWLDSSGSSGPVNQPPVAKISTASCSGLICTFDGSGSSDPDGDTLTYSWTFGDGGTSTAASPTYTYAAGGTYSVQLTVSDSQATNTTGTSVSPSAGGTQSGIAFKTSVPASTPAGGTSISVQVPSGVSAGDGMVLILSNNSGTTTGVTGTPPSGFTQAGVQTAPVTAGSTSVAMTTQVFQKVATASDAGSTLKVTLSAGAKSTLQLLIYSGTAGSNPVRSVAGATDSGGTAHTTPDVTATAGDWVLSVWSDKSSAARTWSAPSGESVRSNIAATGTNGEIATLVGDPGQPVATTGTVSGLQATVPTTSSKAIMLSVVIAGS